jgi:hypothetical protein
MVSWYKWLDIVLIVVVFWVLSCGYKKIVLLCTRFGYNAKISLCHVYLDVATTDKSS